MNAQQGKALKKKKKGGEGGSRWGESSYSGFFDALKKKVSKEGDCAACWGSPIQSLTVGEECVVSVVCLAAEVLVLMVVMSSPSLSFLWFQVRAPHRCLSSRYLAGHGESCDWS